MNDSKILEFSDGGKYLEGVPLTHPTNKKLSDIHEIQVSLETIDFFEKLIPRSKEEANKETMRSIIQINRDIINKLKSKIC